jgi:hypothetical protein
MSLLIATATEVARRVVRTGEDGAEDAVSILKVAANAIATPRRWRR